MDTEIRFISKNEIKIEFTKNIIFQLGLENNWELNISSLITYSYHKNGSLEFSLNNRNYKVVGDIMNESYREFWLLSENDNYLKNHLGHDCFYILTFSYFKSIDHKIDFLLEFSIKLLEKMPNLIVETLEFDDKTFLKEYSIEELYLIKERNLQNNWQAIK